MVSDGKIKEDLEKIICPECQRLNQGDARFCIGCGRKLKTPCPNCGFENPSGKFCIVCGSNLKTSKLAAAFNGPKFLFNARMGENSPWRYILTIILTLGVSSILVGLILGILLSFMLILSNRTLDVLNMLSNPFYMLIIVGMVFSVAYLFLYISVKFLHKRSFKSLINAGRKIDWKRIGKGAIAWFIVMAFMDILYFMISPESFKFSFNPHTFFLLSIIALIAFPIQASFEEIFFRGYLLQAIGLIARKPLLVLVIDSLIFAALHWWNGSNPVMSSSIVISAFIIGLMLGLITLADDGIELAVGIHIVNNLYVALIHNSPDSGLADLPSLMVTPSDPYLSPITLIVAVLLVTFILFRNRKDDILKIFREVA